jgi:putative membrane-bound dehydrogenase-like protein
MSTVASHRLLLLLVLGALPGLFAVRVDSEQPKPVPPFKVPPGFVVERVAGPPLVEHPVMAGFDDRGRLFVAESAGLNLKAADLLTQLPNSIRLLEDTDGDGTFDKSTVFADKMTFPMGVLWHQGAVYSCSPPSLWKLEDTDGDGKADRRQELVSKFGFTGNAADIHGPFLGPDGRLYWTDGRHGHQIDVALGRQLKGKAARIFRCRPDGRDVEVVCGGGMDDPVEMAFTPEGEGFATVDIFIARPARNDAIVHCIEGGVFPYNEVYREFKSTGDLLPPVTFLGWVAPSGLMACRSTALGPDYRGNLFSTLFNTHKVQRHILKREGATFTAKNEDFLVSADPDFHPTDVLEDADGSLLVLDTGGWFRIGCPTSQIAKPDVQGAIWRIRRADARRVTDPWGRNLAWDSLCLEKLTALLDDPRWPVRDRAKEQLARRGGESIPLLREGLTKNGSASLRRNAVWTLCRIDTPEARTVTRIALKDQQVSVRNAAAHSAGLHRDRDALPILADLVVKDAEAEVRREAATALGRIRRTEAVPALLAALNSPADRFLEHALIYALIEIAGRDATIKGLADPNPKVRRAALIALDQMEAGNLTREIVLPLLETDDLPLQQTVLTVVTRRPEWSPQLVAFLRGWLNRPDLPDSRQEILKGSLIAFAGNREIQDLVGESLRREKLGIPARLLLLDVMAHAPMNQLPPGWTSELNRHLDDPNERVARQAVAAIRIRNLKNFDPTLVRVARDPKRPAELRIAALSVASPRLTQLDDALFDFLLARLEPTLPPLDRLSAAAALGPVRLSNEQLERLTASIKSAGPLEMPHLVAPFEHSKDGRIGRLLLAALDKAPGLTTLSPEVLQRTLKGYPDEVHRLLPPFLERLEFDLEKKKARLAELAPVLLGGDGKRGRGVFFSARAACSTCHLVKGEGGTIGPDLSTIGAIRTGKDLLEAVVFPSASFARGFEPYAVATREGRILQGILKREDADAVYLVTAERNEVRIPRSTIESIDPARVSIMPQGLDTQLNRQELADLIAFLQSQK